MQGIVGTEAFGRPGIEPRWTHSNKDGVGTAYSSSSYLRFTTWNEIVTEVYYPTIDGPQLRDLQYLISDGSTFFQEEKRDLKIPVERISNHALGYRCTNADPDGRYTITKGVIGDAPFSLRRSSDSWKNVNDCKSMQNTLQVDYVDLKDAPTKAGTCLRFTFLWTEDNHWEGQNYEVAVR